LNSRPLSEQITELRWLVDELGQELDALVSTPYPRVHRFLLRNLATRIVKVAVQVRSIVTEQSHDTKETSDGVPLLEQSA
jgi:hypothetical protein